MKKEYFITLEKKRNYFYKNILYSASISFGTAIAYMLYEKINELNVIIYLLTASLVMWLIIFGLPLIILFLSHYNQKESKFIIINNESFSFIQEQHTESFGLDDINFIEIYLSFSKYEKRTDWQFFGDFHYTSIYLNNNRRIDISCLIFDEIEEIIPKKMIRKKKKFLPILPG